MKKSVITVATLVVVFVVIVIVGGGGGGGGGEIHGVLPTTLSRRKTVPEFALGDESCFFAVLCANLNSCLQEYRKRRNIFRVHFLF